LEVRAHIRGGKELRTGDLEHTLTVAWPYARHRRRRPSFVL